MCTFLVELIGIFVFLIQEKDSLITEKCLVIWLSALTLILWHRVFCNSIQFWHYLGLTQTPSWGQTPSRDHLHSDTSCKSRGHLHFWPSGRNIVCSHNFPRCNNFLEELTVFTECATLKITVLLWRIYLTNSQMEETHRTKPGNGGDAELSCLSLWDRGTSLPQHTNVFTNQEALGVQSFYWDFIT